MFPRDERKTRSTSRSSFVSTQNSHEVKEPESSVEQDGQVSLVVARRALQTGQFAGGLRAAVRAIYWTSILTLPIVQSQSSVPAPEPIVTPLFLTSSTPANVTSPMTVWALIRTLDLLSSTTRTSPILQRILFAPPSSRPAAVTSPAVTVRSIGPRKFSSRQFPACTSPVTAPLRPLMCTLPACTLTVRASAGFIRIVRFRSIP